MVAEVAVDVCEIATCPATTCPPVGSVLTANGVGGCADAEYEMSAVLAEKMNATVLAEIASANHFFIKDIEGKSDFPSGLLFTKITGFVQEPRFSQTRYFLEISPRVNSL